MARTAPVPNMVAIPGMNPGIFVLGGGGDGGGSGDGSGDGKGGKQGANGKNGGKDANGGGKNAGACGPGSGAGCPNPAHGGGGGTQAGHPIDPITGRVYTVSVVDMALPGAFPLLIQRSYSSAQAEVDQGLGYGWNCSLGWRVIELGRRRVRVITDDALASEGLRPAVGEHTMLPAGELSRTETGYLLRTSDGLARVFDDSTAVDGEWRLSAIVDRNGNRARLFYDGPQGPLGFVNDSVGRLLRVRRGRDGRIAAFEVKDESSGGSFTSFRTYEHDERGDLVAVRDALGNVTRFTYDEDHRLLSERWPTGLEVQYRYDALGRCVETWCTDPNERALLADDVKGVLADGSPARGFLHAKVEYGAGESNVITSRALRRVQGNSFGTADRIVWAGQVHDNQFDAAGELVGYTDGLGRTWKKGHLGRTFRSENPLGHRTEAEYDAAGHVVSVRQADGTETRHVRDDRGNLLTLADVLGVLATFRYDDRGSLVSAETADGAKTSMRYDALGNRVEIVEPDGGTRALRYDFLGRLIEMRDEKGGVHRWTYDAMGRQTRHRSPQGAITAWDYDEMGRLVRITNPDGRWSHLHRAGLREVTAVQRSDGTRVAYAYDRELDMVRVTNEEGDVHTIERDLEGRILLERTFDGRTLRYENDDAGRLAKITFDDDESVELAYDALDRVVARAFSDDTFHKIEYDEAGRVVVFETESIHTRYTYDARGRCVREEMARASDPGRTTTIHHVFDAGMRRKSVSVAGTGSLRAERDAMGRCSALFAADARGAEQPIAAFVHDPQGGESAVLFPRGGGIELLRDAHGNVLRSSVRGPGAPAPVRPGEPLWIGRQGGTETLRVDYEWSPGGEMMRLADRDRGAQIFSYDARGRVTQKRHDRQAATEDYDLSPRGDVRSIHGRAQAHLAGGRLVKASGADLTYDARGRLVRKIEGDRETTFEWSVLGLLTRVTLPDGARVELDYDGFARRVEKRVRRRDEVVRHRYVWDADDLWEETIERRSTSGDGASDFTLVERRRYAYAPRSPMPIAQAIDTPAGPGEWKYFLWREGAPIPLALVRGDGAIEEAIETELYGRVLAGDPDATKSRFPGHWFDRETGLHYNRWRYFDPSTGTYASPEPLGLLGGLEAYGYVNGQPLLAFDADGLARSVTTITGPGGETLATGTSNTAAGPQDLHPAVAAALPVDSARGGATQSHSCSEPVALSNYLRTWEAGPPRRSCDPGTPEGRRNLNQALSGVGGIGSKLGDTNLAACPNCSQTISRLWAMADPPLPPPNVAGGASSTNPLNAVDVPGGYQNPDVQRPVNLSGGRTKVVDGSPLAANMDSPANQGANQAAYAAAGGTGDVSGLQPGVFQNNPDGWGARPPAGG